MATVNPWQSFQNLLPQATRYIVTVDTVYGDGTSMATRRDGQQVRLIGDSISAGHRAWVDGETIIGDAPALITSTEYI